MKKTAFYISSILFLFALIGCSTIVNTSDITDAYEIIYDMEHPMDIQKSGLIESVSLISLQDTSVYIGEITKIEALDTLICIQDKNNKCIYIFSDKGKHISTISGQGHGAGEYLEVTDFFVDAEKKTINILSRLNKKLYVYDINGNGIQTISLPKTFSRIAKYVDGFIGYMANYSEDRSQPHNYWIMDGNGKVVNHFGAIKGCIESRTSESFRPFSSHKGDLSISAEYERSIMTLNNGSNEAQTTYMLDFGKYNWPEIPDKDYNNDEKMFGLVNTHISNPKQFQETDGYLLSLVHMNGQPIIAAYDKESGKGKALSLANYIDDCLLGFGKPICISENEIFAIQDASGMYDVWKGGNEYNDFEKDRPTQVKNLRKRFKNIDEDGNPFIVRYRIR